MRGLARLIVALLATLFAPAPTTVGSGAVHAYDGPTVARVGAHAIDNAGATPFEVSDVAEQSAWPLVTARGTSTTPSSRNHATNTAGRLTGRVDDFHGALDPIAQNSRTTSLMSTRQGTDIIASGGRDLSPAQRALAQDGDVLGRLPGAHAEVTSLDAATKAGLTPAQIAVSRPICGPCQAVIQGTGGEILPGGMGAIWPR